MSLAALKPLFADVPERSGAVETLSALARARLAFRDDLLAFGAPLGFHAEVLEMWLKLGLVQTATVTTDPTRGEVSTVVAATALGARELTRATGPAWKGLSSSRFRRSGRKLVHDGSVGRVALAVLAAHRERHVALRALETDDRPLATSAVVHDLVGNASRVPLQPDALFLMSRDGVLRIRLVELDRGTTSPVKLALKFRAYAEWAKQGGPERTYGVKALRVLTIVPDERREARLREVALRAVGRPSAMFLFARLDDFRPQEPERLVGPIARAIDGQPESPFESA